MNLLMIDDTTNGMIYEVFGYYSQKTISKSVKHVYRNIIYSLLFLTNQGQDFRAVILHLGISGLKHRSNVEG